jgi:hypothetical protein
MKRLPIKFIFSAMLCLVFAGMGQVKGQQVGYNLVYNGRFDLSGQGWAPYYKYTAGSIKQPDCCQSFLEFTPAINAQSMAQEIDYPVKKGDTLIFEFYYRRGGTSTSNTPRASVGGYAPGNTSSTTFISNGQQNLLLVPSLYTKMQQVLIVNNDYTKLRIDFLSTMYLSTSTSDSYINIDDVSLIYKPKASGGTTGGTSSQWTTASPTRIHYNDQVAIGGNKFYNDPNYKLSVNGRMTAEELLVLMRADWPDYVFGSEYPLMPLHELDAYIQRTKHLPGIPSATAVKEKGGVEIGELNRKLVEKIEELTLYILQQQKRIESLEKKTSGQ